MIKLVLALHDQATELRYPESFQAYVDLLFGPQRQQQAERRANHVISIRETGPDRYTISGDTSRRVAAEVSTAELLDVLLEEVVHSLICELNTAVGLHAALVSWQGRSILIPGPSGVGKSSLAGWFVARKFGFLSDELVVLPGIGRTTLSFPRPLLAKSESDGVVSLMARSGAPAVRTAGNVLVPVDRSPTSEQQERQAGLIVFPRFIAGSELELACVSPALASVKLMECNLNARNLADHGRRLLTAFARDVPALSLTYGDYAQLDGVLDVFARLVLENDSDVAAVQRFAAAFRSRSVSPPGAGGSLPRSEAPPSTVAAAEIPAATPRGKAAKLTVGMATYDDFDGVYFTLQAIRFYHAEVLNDIELLVVDDHPDGPYGQALKKFEDFIPNYRYIPKSGRSGTAARDLVFREASGDFVLCVDCHVFIAQGALKRLIDYVGAHPDTNDLLQGPMLSDNLTSLATSMVPQWREGMWGIWERNPAGEDADQPPFEISMQGLGLFACRRQAWPGFNPAFSGFGGEEGYIHEKFRQRGGRTLCLPFLRWLHRFARPLGAPYRNRWEDRLRNYLIGFRELGLDTTPVTEHFKDLLGEPKASQTIARVEGGLAALAALPSEAGPPAASSTGPAVVAPDPFASVWDETSLERQRRLLQRVAAIAEDCRLPLHLYWGTLLGQIRERRILPWDDDVDCAVFDMTQDRYKAFRAALHADGLHTWDLHSVDHVWTKVCDPAYPVTSHCRWSWPFVDIFIYSGDAEADGPWPRLPVPRELVCPGRPIVFEGARCWEPEQPLALLDLHYPGWRTAELTSAYNHRREQRRGLVVSRAIRTDSLGLKIQQ